MREQSNIKKVKVAQSCLTLCHPMDLVHGILQARIWEWVAFPFSRGSFNPGIEPSSPTLQADSLPAEPQGKPIAYRRISIVMFLPESQTGSLTV